MKKKTLIIIGAALLVVILALAIWAIAAHAGKTPDPSASPAVSDNADTDNQDPNASPANSISPSATLSPTPTLPPNKPKGSATDTDVPDSFRDDLEKWAQENGQR